MKITPEISSFEENSKSLIDLSDGVIINYNTDGQSQILKSIDIYKIVFTNEKSKYSFSEQVLNIDFSKLPLKIRLVASFEKEKVRYTIKFFNNRFSSNFKEDEIAEILEVGYIIKENVWHPVDLDDLNELKTVLSEITNSDKPLIQLNILFNYRRFQIIDLCWTENEYKLFISENKEFGIPNAFTKQLYEYQKSGLKWLQYCYIRNTGTLLGDDMGLGKTAQIISLVSWLVEENLSHKILIVVPSTLLENWRREFLFFAPSIEIYLHHGIVRTGSVNEITAKSVIITSYSLIINDLYLFNKIDWNLIIADEASLLKNPDSERRIALSSLTRKLFIAMSGTPIENSLLDLWSLIDLVSPGYFGSKEDFTNKYIKKTIERTLVESDLAEIKSNLNYLLIRRKKEDVLDSLPPRIDIHQALKMSSLETTEYEQSRLSILNEANEHNSTTSIFPLIQELRQFTTYPRLNQLSLDELKSIALTEHLKSSNKLSRLFELLDEISKSGEKVLIFTEYLKMIDLLGFLINLKFSCKIYNIDGRKEALHRQVEIDQFSDESGFAVMILNPKTAGMGLNITAANHVVHYTRQWNPALEEQASARAYRNKQTKPVNIYYLYYVNTIEEFIDNRLRQKTQLSSEIITVNSQEFTSDELKAVMQMSPK